ncbi:LacI family DNA-binding transcriptional regulator [Alicyclobacillus sp. SO9]|uniref:LacI family DNA-binding transcriptional regulator n=1 Tax=Alicyclobacillus sp. SO9 TaxID=2665646 RepID=UPI0018E7EE83|nr:LacI family DNA-binding transcriptional regulator [Alicyclobacillus sp. SO9]QQE78641.1 LacI family DNA-binding transcriptional regulator [Alicyclobacillus sp. SO9]
MTTIKDVARMANVSASTVSRVLADSPRISAATKRRVREVLEHLDYHPNTLARGLVTNTTSAIGVLMPYGGNEFFENPFFAQMMSGVSEVANENGYDIVLFTSGPDTDTIDRVIRGRRVDGIFLLSSKQDDPVLKLVEQQKFPAVLLGRAPDGISVSTVNNDNVSAAYKATEHLIRLGHKRIGFLGGASDLVVTLDRVTGYRNALRDYQLEPDAQLEVSSFFLEQGGYLGMMRLLASSDRPTAVLASDDVLAFGAMRASAELGYHLPSELAIVGFNDIRMAEIANPSLTSVRVHMHELGSAAANMLLEHIKNSDLEPQHKTIRTELVVRNSCGASYLNTSSPLP